MLIEVIITPLSLCVPYISVCLYNHFQPWHFGSSRVHKCQVLDRCFNSY